MSTATEENQTSVAAPSVKERITTSISVFTVPGFAFLLGSNSTNMIGFQIRNMAQSWLVLEMTDSAFLVGVVNAVPALGLLLFSPIGGALADRYNKLGLLRYSRFAVSVLVLITSYLVASGLIELWHLYVLGFFVGIGFALGNAASQTLVFDIVGKERLLSAISLNTMASNLGTVVGPAVGGVLAASVGIGGTFWLLSGVYAFGYLALLGIRGTGDTKPAPSSTSPVKDITDGIKYTFGTPGINWLMVLMMTIIFWGAMQPVIPVYARDILDVGADGFGYIFGAGALGALVSAVWIFASGDVKNKPRWILIAVYIYAAGAIGFALSTNFTLSLALFFLSGLGAGIWMTFMFTVLQTSVAPEMRSRVMGVAIAVVQLLGLGYLLGGAMSEFVSPAFSIIASSVAWALVTTFAYAKSKELRAFA